MGRQNYAAFALLFLIVACGTEDTFAGDVSGAIGEPHPHHGKLQPYVGEPPDISLTPAEQKVLESNQPVYKQVQTAGGARAAAKFRVNAPRAIVADVISSFSKYPEWISSCKGTKVYSPAGSVRDHIYVGFKIGLMMWSWTYYIDHNMPLKEKGWATWTLDYDRKSEVDDSVGFWKIRAVNARQTDVSYSVDILLNMPDFVRNIAINNGIKEATTWVKVQSENRAKEE